VEEERHAVRERLQLHRPSGGYVRERNRREYEKKKKKI
jgi:hypothetical protein